MHSRPPSFQETLPELLQSCEKGCGMCVMRRVNQGLHLFFSQILTRAHVRVFGFLGGGQAHTHQAKLVCLME
jgi:hypothetical protein